MVKVEDATILSPEMIDGANCPICGKNIVWGEEGTGFVALHCDRSFSAEVESYKVTVKKLTPENIANAIEANKVRGSETSIKSEEESEEEELGVAGGLKSVFGDEDEPVKGKKSLFG